MKINEVYFVKKILFMIPLFLFTSCVETNLSSSTSSFERRKYTSETDASDHSFKKMRRLYTKRVGREDAGQAVYAKRNDWTNGKEWIYREKTRRKRFKKKQDLFH